MIGLAPSAPAQARVDDRTHVGIGSWALVALVPGSLLAFDPGGWTPFGPAKWLAVTAIGAAVITWNGVEHIRRHRDDRDDCADSVRLDPGTTGAGLVLLVLIALAAWRAVDPLYAWLGTPERHLGVVAWLVFAGVFVGAQRAAPATARRVSRAMAVSLVAIDAYAVAEWSGHPPVDLSGTTTRFGGPFGSPALLGGAVVLLLPAAVGLALDRSEPRWWRIVAALAGAGAAVPLLGSESRAAIVALAAAVGALVVARRSAATPRRWLVGVGTVAVLAALVALTPVTGRLADVVSGDAGGRGRLDEWRIGVSALGERPFLGAGPEGYRIVFPQAVDDDYVRHYGRDVVTDRAHNGVLDVGLAAGIPAALAAAVLLALVARRAWRVLAVGDAAAVGLATAVVGFVVHEQLLFPTAELDPVFWLAAGLVVTAGAGASHAARVHPAARAARSVWPARPAWPARAAQLVVTAGTGAPRAARVHPTARTAPDARPAWSARAARSVWSARAARLVVAVAGTAVVVATIAGGLDLAADRAALDALDASARRDTEAAVAAADRARDRRPDSMRYDLVAAAVAGQPGTASSLTAALARIDDGLQRSARDPVLRRRRAELLAARAELTRTTADQDVARAAWTALAADDPRHPATLLGLGRTAARQGDVTAAESAFSRAEALAPRDPAPATALALLYLEDGRRDDARRAAERALAVDPADPEARRVYLAVVSGAGP